MILSYSISPLQIQTHLWRTVLELVPRHIQISARLHAAPLQGDCPAHVPEAITSTTRPRRNGHVNFQHGVVVQQLVHRQQRAFSLPSRGIIDQGFCEIQTSLFQQNSGTFLTAFPCSSYLLLSWLLLMRTLLHRHSKVSTIHTAFNTLPHSSTVFMDTQRGREKS